MRFSGVAAAVGLLITTNSFAAPQVIYVPAGFPSVCALELNSGRDMCPTGVTESAGDFCASGLTRLNHESSRIGVSPCSGGSGEGNATQAELVLLVDDRNLNVGLRGALAPVIVTSGASTSVGAAHRVFRNRAGTVVRDTIIIGEVSGKSIEQLLIAANDDESGGSTEGSQPDQTQGCRSFGQERVCRQQTTTSGEAELRMQQAFSGGVCLEEPGGITCQSDRIASLTIQEPEGRFLMMDELQCEQSERDITCSATVSDVNASATSECTLPGPWPEKAFLWQIVIPDTLQELAELMALKLEDYLDRRHLGMHRYIELTTPNSSLSFGWPDIERYAGATYMFHVDYQWAEFTDQNGICLIEAVNFTADAQVLPGPAQFGQDGEEPLVIYAHETALIDNESLEIRESNGTAQEEASGEQAQIHYERGVEFYLQEHYLGAVEEFMAAYAEKPHHAYIYNTAVAYERQSNYTLAADNFARYLLERPDAPDSDPVRRRIDILRTRALQSGQVPD